MYLYQYARTNPDGGGGYVLLGHNYKFTDDEFLLMVERCSLETHETTIEKFCHKMVKKLAFYYGFGEVPEKYDSSGLELVSLYWKKL